MVREQKGFAMNREVMLSISGLHAGGEADNGSVETMAEAEYFYKNGSHYIIYEEKAEGFEKTSKCRIKFKENILELTRQGLLETHMIFEKDKKHMTMYQTPYGQMLLEVDTRKLLIMETDNSIRVLVEYILEADGAYLSDSKIEIVIRNKAK